MHLTLAKQLVLVLWPPDVGSAAYYTSPRPDMPVGLSAVMEQVHRKDVSDLKTELWVVTVKSEVHS